MRLLQALLAMAAVNTANAENNDWWSNEGNLCQLPEGSFNSSCSNISLELCSNSLVGQNPCKFSLDCYTDPTRATVLHTTVYLPRAVKFMKVENHQGILSHPEITKLLADQPDADLPCNPCSFPTGNYVDSCKKITIRHLSQFNACLFRAYCDPYMRKHGKIGTGGKINYVHNEALLPENTQFTDVKNLWGKVIHPSIKFNPVNDLCYETGDTEQVAVNSASASSFRADALTATVAFSGLLLSM